jgi:UDP-glucuronate decarboxylase
MDAFGWQPKVGLDRGLEATIAYFALSVATASREATVAGIDATKAARAGHSRHWEAAAAGNVGA